VSGAFRRVQNPCRLALQARLTASTGRLWATCVTGMLAFLVTSDDGGSHWTQVTARPDRRPLPNSVTVGAVDNDTALVVAVPGDGVLERVHPSGSTGPTRSHPAADPNAPDYSFLGFTTATVGYAVSGTTLWRTDDGGDTWRALAP
jgi:photosystem II stability/assembly factor-like uncharacterized protein